MEITSLYQKTRREFGRAVNTFSTTEPESLGSWPSDWQIKANYVERDPAILELQAVPEMSEHEVNTESFAYVTHGMLHTEGGWPKDIDCAEKEQTTRYRKKVEKDEEYIRQVKALGEGVEHSIMQNSAIDIYQEYFAGEYADHSSEPPSAKTLSVFKDPAEVKRTVCSISWYPDGGKKLAVAFAIMQFQDWRMEGMSSLSYKLERIHQILTPFTRVRKRARSRPRRRLCHADNALKLGMGPFQRRSRAAQPAPMTTGCLRDAGAAGRTTNRPPLCGEAPGQRRTLSV